MRKTVTLLIGAASVAALLAITACKQFTADIEEDFSYWAAEPVITGFKIDPSVKTQQNNNRVLCVPSAGPVTVTMEVHNPKNFSFIMPNSPGAPTDIVSFGDDKVKGSGGAKPVYGADYTLVPTSDGKALELTYTSAFLKANEWSDANIGASIKLYSTDGRKFSQNYKFDLEANTPPPDPSITFAKTTGSPSYYVLCIEVPNMPGVVVNGKPLHKDIAHIAINDAEYELKMNTGNTDFVRPGNSSFITTGAESLDGSGTPMTPGAWVLYYKTSTAIGGPKASYTVTLKDAKGLWSQASATTPPAPITDWGTLRTAVQTASDGAVITVGGDITYSNTGAKSTIEVTKNITVKSDGTKRTLNAGGTGADGSSANQKSEAVFEVKGSGITLTLEDLTLTKTEKYAVYVYNGASLVMNKVTIEDCKTSFNAAGICFHGGKDLSITDSVIKKCKGKGSSSSGGIDIQAPQAGGTLSITSTTFENCKAVGNGTRKGNGGGINIYKGSVTLTGCTFTGCEAKNGGGIYLSGNASCTLDSVTMQGNTAPNGKGSAVYVDKTASDTPTLTLKGNVQIGTNVPNSNTLCLGYAVNGSTIQTAFVSATSADLSGTSHINIEPENYEKQSNLDLVKGTNIGWNDNLFHLTNMPTSEGNWNLTNMVDSIPNVNRLALKRTTAVLSAPYTGSWKALKEAIQSVSSGGTLKLSGTFKATSGDDSGEILLRKVLTIEGNSSAVIDADNKCRIFNLQNYLILKDVTLERGDATSSDDTNGGAVYVSNVGELKIEGSTFIVPPATAAAGKNDVYLKGDRKISVDGALTGGYPVARITPENYSGGTQVLYGDITSGTPQNNTKFAVTPENDGTVWCVGADGKLALVQTETLTAANETQLENNILNAVIGKPRIITITADISSSSIFEIQSGRDITIKADGTQKTLTCELPPINKNVFHIKSGGKLTLEGNIKLQGTNYGSFERFGIYVEQGGIAEIKDNVVITGFQKTGSACVYTNGTLIMSGGKITGNQADNGGGVFIFNNGTFTMTGGTITGNHANTNGKAMWIRGIFNWLGGTITGNTGTGDVLHIKLNGKINNPYGFEAS